MSTDKAHIYIDVGEHTLDEEAIRKDEYLQRRVLVTVLKSDYQIVLR